MLGYLNTAIARQKNRNCKEYKEVNMKYMGIYMHLLIRLKRKHIT